MIQSVEMKKKRAYGINAARRDLTHVCFKISIFKMFLYTTVPLHNSSSTQQILYTTVPLHNSSSTQQFLYTTDPLHNSSPTQQFLYTTVPLHNSSSTQQFLCTDNWTILSWSYKALNVKLANHFYASVTFSSLVYVDLIHYVT